ncbi:unnamed protein product [Orchesella dallaii]|uniref:Uncharacterized protein n=1 Tax=Orchesella dallaii TaxID=48710 RepID=A0ABP1SB61_9HEXA
MDPAALKRKRGVEKGNITKSLTWISALDKDTVNTVYLKNKREIIQGYYNNFQEYQLKIEEQCPDDDELLVQIAERDDFEEKFLIVISKVDDMIIEKTPEQLIATAAPNPCHHSHTPMVPFICMLVADNVTPNPLWCHASEVMVL